MKPLSEDTHPDAEQIQIDLLRQASLAKRFSLACSLSQTTMSLARRAIQRRYPQKTLEEMALMFVAIHYGENLAERVQADLAERQQL